MGQCCVSVGLYNCVCIHGKNTLQFPVSPLRHTGCIHSPHQPYRTFPFLYSTLPFPCSLSPRYTPPMYWMSEVAAAAAEPSSRQPGPSRASLQKLPVNLSPLSNTMVPVGDTKSIFSLETHCNLSPSPHLQRCAKKILHVCK